MYMKAKARVLTVFAAMTLILCGCGNGNMVVSYQENEEEVIDITFFGNKYEPENVTVIEEIISGFMKENPQIRVSYESIKGNEYYEALGKRMAAGRGDDVFMVNHDILLELEQQGKVMELSGLDTLSEYTEQMLGQMEEDGKIYWVPTTVSAFGLFCNLDLMKKHRQEIPSNLEEWRRVNDYFLSQGITPVIANNDISLKTLAIGLSFYQFYQDGTQEDVFEGLNKGERKLSEYLEVGFAVAEELVEKGYIDASKALVTKKTSDDLVDFVRGETPFMLTGAWAAGRVEGMEPDFEFQVIPYPVLENGSLLVVNADTRLSINADSENPEAALQFVEYFTRTENIQKFADQQSSISPLKGGSPSSVTEIQPLLPDYEQGRVVIGTDGRLDLPIWSWTAEISKQLLEGSSLQNAMEWLDQQTEQLERKTQ